MTSVACRRQDGRVKVQGRWVGLSFSGKDVTREHPGVGVLVAERWVDKVMEVKRISDRIIVVRVMVGRLVLNVVSVYAPQVGRAMEEKEEFYISLGNVLSSIGSGEQLAVCGDMNGHVGSSVGGFNSVHGGHGFGHRNVEGEMLLEFADAMDLVVANTWFEKSERVRCGTLMLCRANHVCSSTSCWSVCWK